MDDSIILLGFHIAAKRAEKRRRKMKRTEWVSKFLVERKEKGFFSVLKKELILRDQERFRRYLQMDTDTFYEIVEAVRPLIEKKQTHLRETVSSEERVAITLRYLATGESYRSLDFAYRVSYSLISKFVPEVCEAIYIALKVCQSLIIKCFYD